MASTMINEINNVFYDRHQYEKFNKTHFILKTNNFIIEPKNNDKISEEPETKQINSATLTDDNNPLSTLIIIFDFDVFFLMKQIQKK